MQTLSRKQEMQITSLNWLLFPYPSSNCFFKINRAQAVYDIDKLCKFHENLITNLTENVDFIE